MPSSLTTVGAVLKGIVSGKSIQTLERPVQGNELGILKVSAVTWGAFRPAENKALPAGHDPKDCPRPMDGDILISRANTRELVGAPVMVQGNHPQLLLSDKLLKLIPDETVIDARYLVRALRSPSTSAHFYKSAGGSSGSMTNITQSDIRTAPIYLPPLPEQRRIAAILDQAETLRTQRRAALAQLDSLTQSIFLDMFGDPVANPKEWPTSPLAEVSNQIQIGPFGSLLHQEDYVTDGIPLVNPMHIKDGKILPGLDQCITQQKYDQLSIYQLRAGDLVMGRRGEMGRCAIVTAEHGALMCGTGSLFIRPNTAVATATYLFHVLSSASMKAKLEEFSLGATMPNLNKGIVAGLRVSRPPLPLQQTFATRIQAIEALKATHRAALAQLDALFASLQQRAFAGEL